MPTIDYVTRVNAPREVVFEVMTDHAAHSKFTRLWKTKLEQEGDPAPNGVGAIRNFKAAPLVAPSIREEIIAYDPPATMSYKALSGVPLKDHVGTITLIPSPAGGTDLRYHVETTPTARIGKFLVMAVVRRAIRDLATGIKREAERRAAKAAV